MAADLAQLEAALVKADAAGDVEGARTLAAEVRRLRSATPAAPAPTDPLEMAGGVVKKALLLTPPGLAYQAGTKINEAIEKGAYDAGGAVTDFATNKGASPETAAALGYGTNVLTQTVPAVLAGGPAKSAAPVLRAGAEKLMRSALKPGSEAIASGDAARAVKTLLDEGVNVSTSGAAKMRELISGLHNQVQARIADATEKGAAVPRSFLDREIHEQLTKFKNQVDPSADIQKVMDTWKRIRDALPERISVEAAQKLKQGTYKILSEKYAKMGAVENEASTQTQMAAARGLRKGIEEAAPGVGDLNARESALINALELAEKRAGIAGNRDLAGIAWLAANPKAAAAMLADRSPAFKSILARLMNAGQAQVPAAAARSGTGAYMSDQGER